jgi:hypothetical protein
MNSVQTHTIRFTFGNSRLYISMDVLRTIGDPDFIQVFISRDRMTLFIRGCDKKEVPCFAVPSRVYEDPEYKCILRKVAFAEAISLAQKWDRKGNYRLYGVPISQKVIGFAFAKAERIDNGFCS